MQKFHNMTMTDTHVYFWRNHTPFSNFYRKPFLYKGHELLFSEQAFMIEKALQFDPEKVELIANTKYPQDAKAIGRQIRNYNDNIWASKRYHAMVQVLEAKFSDPELKEILRATGDRIIVEHHHTTASGVLDSVKRTMTSTMVTGRDKTF